MVYEVAEMQRALAGAKGSFGLCVSSSLDAHRQLVVAARGQTLSVACYPRSGIVLWGSEQAAVKAAMQVLHRQPAIGCCSEASFAGWEAQSLARCLWIASSGIFSIC